VLDCIARQAPTGARRLNASAAIHSGQQPVDDLFGNPLVIKVRARDVPPSHCTVQSDQPRDTVSPEVPRPKLARVVCGPRVVCSSAVRS
jgi:hypothetical protein